MSNTATGQTFAASSRSLYADIKAYGIGDVVTVLIVETARASRESKVENSSKSDMSLEGSVSGDLGKFTKFLPMFGASSGMSNSHRGSEGTQQKEQLTGKLSAMITEITGNGTLKIKGERIIEVNGEKNLMRLEGMIRPRDIRADNTVYSYKIANANITYEKGGFMNKFIKPGILHKWTTWVIGLGLIGLAFVGAA